MKQLNIKSGILPLALIIYISGGGHNKENMVCRVSLKVCWVGCFVMSGNLISLKQEITSPLLLSAHLHGKKLARNSRMVCFCEKCGSENHRFILSPRCRLARTCALERTPFCMLHAVFYVTQLEEGLIYRYTGVQEQGWLHRQLL